MDYANGIEKLVAIHLATLEMQIQSIRMFGQQRFPAALTHQTKVLAEALLRSLETIEQQYIDEVENEAEDILGKFAEFTKILETTGNNDDPEQVEALRRIAKITKKGHHALTSTLSQEEMRLTTDIIERFKKMKGGVSSLIKRIDDL